MLFTPNHSFHYDSYVLMDAAERLHRPIHFLTAWQVFAMSNRFQQWSLQRHGCFSIDRESADLQAFKTAVDVLQNSPYPLVIFPEGDIYHTNDRLTPFREGAAAIAMSAAKKATRPIFAVPVALKCWYVSDPARSLHAVAGRMEKRLSGRAGSGPLAERLYALGEAVLTQKERLYLGVVQTGTIPERIHGLTEALLVRQESRHGLRVKSTLVPERVKELRRHHIAALDKEGITEADRRALVMEMEELFAVVQLFSYPGDYVSERPTTERLAETFDKLEEDVLELDFPTRKGDRRAVVRFGEPVEVVREAGRRDGVGQLTATLEGRVQAMLDEMNGVTTP